MSEWSVLRIPTLYHFTDTRNLASVRTTGGLHPLASLRRMGIEIPAPGGNELSHELDAAKGLDEYVHLCFRNRHPMEYQIRKSGQIAESVFLNIDPVVVSWDDICFTANIANATGVEVHPIREVDEMIDFEVLYTATNWKDPEIQQRLRSVERYEVLVPHSIPLELIRNLPHG